MTTSRRHLFALLGLVLPVAAFTVSPAAAATSSSLHTKSHVHHRASHKASPRHTGSVHHASHRTSHHAPRPTAS